LAVWILSRAFVCPELSFGAPKVSTIAGEKVKIVGGGGMKGYDYEGVGNDSFYRVVNDSSDGSGDDVIATITKEIFALTNNIKLPSMKDITNEVLLCDNYDESKDEEHPQYEQHDMHLSNSHRFYLFNGMADGEPLTLCDLASVALSTLNAKSRIEAERKVENDPLFEVFVKTAYENGFFNEKKLGDVDGEGMLSAEEEGRRQRAIYASRYRKVLAKFRSKLAVKEEQQMSNMPLWAKRALASVSSVSDRLVTRRDCIIRRAQGGYHWPLRR
jgi:hypothetical protein